MHILHLLFVVVEFAVVLGIMVLVHEFGHFAVAKLCGVRVETFSIGFGKRVLGYTYKGTDYRLSILPLGGYVKMAGEMGGDTASGAPDEFTSKPRWQRVLVALAGPFSNFVLAFVLLALVAHYHHEVDKYLNGPAIVDYVPQNTPAARDGLAAGDTILSFNGLDHPTWEAVLEECQLNLKRSLPFTFTHQGQLLSGVLTVSNADNSGEISPDDLADMGLIPQQQPGPISVTDITAGTPAARAGMETGDLIERIDAIEPHSVPALLAYLRDRNGAPATLQIQRGGQPLTLNVTPVKMEVPGAATQYRLGFAYRLPPVDVVRLPWGAAVSESVKENRHSSTLILRVLQGMFTRHVSVKSLSGPVGIAQQIDIATQLGTWTLLTLIATISLNLGIFNLLPFPPLDGGMILFLLIESVIRRDVNQQVKERIYQIAFVCVVFLAVFVLFNDITRLHLGH